MIIISACSIRLGMRTHMPHTGVCVCGMCGWVRQHFSLAARTERPPPTPPFIIACVRAAHKRPELTSVRCDLPHRCVTHCKLWQIAALRRSNSHIGSYCEPIIATFAHYNCPHAMQCARCAVIELMDFDLPAEHAPVMSGALSLHVINRFSIDPDRRYIIRKMLKVCGLVPFFCDCHNTNNGMYAMR